MATNVNAISWFEIPVRDMVRAKEFYTAVLLCELQDMNVGELQLAAFPIDQTTRGVSGALARGKGYVPRKDGTVVYLNGGEDLQPILDRVPGAGGKVHTPKTEIGQGMGFFALIDDTEGNRVGLYSQR